MIEHNPGNGKLRGWNECYDHMGNVNRIHPKNINGQEVISPPLSTNSSRIRLMSYTNKRLGEELKIQLERGFDIVNISQWAYKIYLNNLRNLDPITEETLEYLFRMADDPDFEYSESERPCCINALVSLLQTEERSPSSSTS